MEIDEERRDRRQQKTDKERERNLQILLAAIGSCFVVGEVSSSVRPNILSPVPERSSSNLGPFGNLNPSIVGLSLLDVVIHVIIACLFTVSIGIIGIIISYCINPQGTKQTALLLWQRVVSWWQKRL